MKKKLGQKSKQSRSIGSKIIFLPLLILFTLLGILTIILGYNQYSQDNRSQAKSYKGCFSYYQGKCYGSDRPYNYCNKAQGLFDTERECQQANQPKPTPSPSEDMKVCFLYDNRGCTRTDAVYQACNPARNLYDTRAKCREANGIDPNASPSPKTCYIFSNFGCKKTDMAYDECDPKQKLYDTLQQCQQATQLRGNTPF